MQRPPTKPFARSFANAANECECGKTDSFVRANVSTVLRTVFWLLLLSIYRDICVLLAVSSVVSCPHSLLLPTYPSKRGCIPKRLRMRTSRLWELYEEDHA